MSKLRLTAEALIAGVVLNALLYAVGMDRFGWVATIASAAILTVLLTFDRKQARSFGQSAAYGAVCGFLLATAAVFPLDQYLHDFTAGINVLPGHPLLPAFWLAGALAFLTADRVRNTTTPITVQLGRIDAQPAAPAAALPRTERASVVEPVPEPVPESVPEPAQVIAAPIPELVIPPNAIGVKPQPAPKGKPAVIHVNILGTGITCLRPVAAERLARDFYCIVEPMPEGEDWEFRTGQIVRCRKLSLSSGKGLVAFEEAPRVN